MCATCGCEQKEDGIKILKPGEKTFSLRNELESGHHHGHGHDHEHHHHEHDHDHHAHSHHDSVQIDLEKNVLQENNLLAERNRGYFEALDIYAVNLVSSPGSGKTTLLEETVKTLKEKIEIAIIEGDQQSTNDADRIAATNVPVVQINTGKGCHLDAHMVLHAVKKLEPKNNSLLFIENVGNLVCPAMFDLGENQRVVIISVTEGDDKPMKYPYMFDSSQICIINKIDLLPYVNFSVEKVKKYALQINHRLEFFELSATTGEGMAAWTEWLSKQMQSK